MLVNMTPQVLQSKLTAEGRATVPAAARKALGVGAGDRLVFIVEGDQVCVTSSRQMAMLVWANNHGADAGDSTVDVCVMRQADVEADEDSWEATDAGARAFAEDESDEEGAARLLAAVGLQP